MHTATVRRAPALLAALAALALGACQTTGSSGPAAGSLQTSQPGDAGLSCEQLAAQIGEMDTILGRGNDAAGAAFAADAGTAAATQAALYSGAGSSIPFLGMFGNAATSMARQQAEQQEQRRRQAEMRRISLMGLYQGKGCG
jgi:hypothetical protein